MPEVPQEVLSTNPADFAWVVMTEEEREAEREEWQSLGGDLGYIPAYQVA